VTGSRLSILPGLVFIVSLGVLANELHQLPVPPFSIGTPARHPIDAMLIAIVLGMLVRNTVGLPAAFAPGARFCVTSLMSLGIVLMGAKLDFYKVAEKSAMALIACVVCVAVALTMTVWLCRRFGVGQKLGLLVGIGTAICGGTAIAVVAPVIEAEESETAFAIATVTLFGMVALFVLPLLGAAIGMTQLEFGVWAGTSVHQTPQVIATGFAYGERAGEVATVVKLVRVLLLAPVAVGLGLWYAREKRRRQIAHVTKYGKLRTLFPPFILGFVGLALANTLQLLPDLTLHLRDSFAWSAQDVDVRLAKLATTCSGFVLTMGMAGVGLGVHLRGLARTGLGALYVGLVAAVILAGFSFALVQVMV
jgi:uncharacterized integral membrane protein (TIGR00698 family)